MSAGRLAGFVACVALAAAAAAAQEEDAQAETAAAVGGRNRIVQEGIAVDFQIESVARPGAAVMEQDAAVVRFRLSDAASGAPIKGVRPAAWLDLRKGVRVACKDKVGSFLQSSLAYRPDVDLNSYYIVTLNDKASVSVIDPILSFGTSKLVTRVLLPSPGEDWALSGDGKRLFVSAPAANQVVAIDTTSWKVVASLLAGNRPTRVTFQPDGKYLWVADAAASRGGVTVIDPAALRVVKRIATGAGRQDIAFSVDSRQAFVASPRSGSVAVVDVASLRKVREIRTGQPVTALAYSTAAQALYGVSEKGDSIFVSDGARITARIKALPGLAGLRFSPDGRWGLALAPASNRVVVIDASVNRVAHMVDIGEQPDQVSFTGEFAYVRAAGSEQVSMIPLSALATPNRPPVTRFPGGQNAPANSKYRSVASAIVAAPEGKSVLVANPPDKAIYYYTQGMAAPMGSFQTYGLEPRAVLVIDRSLRETAPGVYAAEVVPPRSGTYDVAFLLDSPRVLHCFTASVKANLLARKERGVPFNIEYLVDDRSLVVGEARPLRFRLTDAATGDPMPAVRDVRVLAFLAPGVWHKRVDARPVGDGVYEVSLAVPRRGVYYVFVESPSAKVRYNQLPHLILQAGDRQTAHQQ